METLPESAVLVVKFETPPETVIVASSDRAHSTIQSPKNINMMGSSLTLLISNKQEKTLN